mmetsp:Transcript_9493/g.41552  ORF Transcript_9493/g.41552 Transcript_9493/m.41552 type:complete len:331 (+) Transcript_9493:2613-3605(+)
MSRLMFDEKKVTSARNLPPTDAALDLLTRVAKPSTPAAAAVSSSRAVPAPLPQLPHIREVSHGRPPVGTVPRRLEVAQVIQHPSHRLGVERLPDHDATAARAHGEHGADPGRPDNLRHRRAGPEGAAGGAPRESHRELRPGGQRVFALVQHADQLVHVVGAEGGALAEGHGVEREAANRRRRLVDFAKPKAVGQKRGHVSVHRLLLRGGQLQVFGNQERLPVQRRGALEPFEVVNLVGRVLIDDEEVVAQGAEDETEVELTDDSHLAKVLAAKHPLELAGGCLVAPLVQRGVRALLLPSTRLAPDLVPVLVGDDLPRGPSLDAERSRRVL